LFARSMNIFLGVFALFSAAELVTEFPTFQLAQMPSELSLCLISELRFVSRA